MKHRVLVLSDGELPAAGGATVVADREAAAERLDAREFAAICLDRGELSIAVSDANWLRKRRNRLPVVALVEADEVERATELLTIGVRELVVRDRRALDSLESRLEWLVRLAGDIAEPRAAQRVTARSPAMRACLEAVAKAQDSHATALLQGETGTGKEVIARVIHEGGPRNAAKFVAINCGAFPETLLESELFGYERGAFTGANRSKRGLFEEAAGGTLFLDEIGETAPGFQVKLLRVLQEGVVRPLGTTRELSVDVRVVAATNRELTFEVEAGRFRRDLFYRLNVLPIQLPPLRSRPEDIVLLAEQFLAGHPGAPSAVAADAARLLEAYRWPGNVRELENEIARIAAHACGEPEVTARMLSPQLRGLQQLMQPNRDDETLRQTMARFEAWVVRRALERHGGRRIATAKSLGITRECLYKKMKRLAIE